LKQIIIKGDGQSGKSDSAKNLIKHLAVRYGDKCLVVAPRQEEAEDIERDIRFCKDPDVKCIGASRFNESVRSHYYDVIALIDISRFPENKEGSYEVLASQRLIHKNQCTLILVDEGFSIEKSKWVSTATWWKPWTWNRGYYAKGPVQ